MTSNEQKAGSRKRLLLVGIVSAVILTGAWITYFLLSFDLNNYRQEAEKKLSSLLSLPVVIGALDFKLHNTNLALHVSKAQIGDQSSSVEIDAPDILINLKWRGLLQREFSFAKINLRQPLLKIRTTGREQSGVEVAATRKVPFIIDQSLLYNISIDTLGILDGRIEVEVSRPGQTLQQITMTEISGEISDIQLNQASQVTMRGALKIPGQEKPSTWQLDGQSMFALDDSKGLEPSFNYTLQVEKLNLNSAWAIFKKPLDGYDITGIGDLKLFFAGSPHTSIDFQGELLSKRITLQPGPSHKKPILFQKLLTSGRLELLGEHPGIREFSLQIDDSQLAGAINWAPRGKPLSTTITLLNSKLTPAIAKQWVPEELKTWETIRQGLLDEGVIQVDRAEFTLFSEPDAQKKWRVDLLQGELKQISWQQEGKPGLEIKLLSLKLANNLWQIDKGDVRLGSLQLALHGTGTLDKDGLLVTSLDFSAKARPEELLDEWHIQRHTYSTHGDFDISGHLEGPLSQLSLDLQADLSRLGISLSNGLKFEPGSGDRFTLHGTLSPAKISLDQAALTWSLVKGHMSGSYFSKDPDSLALDARFTINDLSKLAESIPVLEKFKVRGQADLNIKQRGMTAENREMFLTLRDGGLRATSLIADLNQINGRIQLTETGMKADNLRVHIGKSPLTVQARLADFAKPNLIIDAKSATMHADDLVFYSDKAMLRNIDGHLTIDAKGLVFDPVDVELDGGTKASVRGTISFHPPYTVLLDITSEFARISEVIGLWTDRSKPRIVNQSAQKKSTVTIKVNAHVKSGDLYGMNFHDASGVIVPSHGRLSVHPLDFSVDGGFCNAQVITDFFDKKPTVLRISGHAEDVNALKVYQELFNKRNIVRGKLRGDFYLIGEVGSNYLPSSYGNFSIQVRQGVLHQFQTLSKVFSLLNVSQLFALKLPDMDTEGMPFDMLSANLQLDKGVLKSEDLQIRSEAMNQAYSGQISLIDKEIDLIMIIYPLGTIDKVVSRIPVAGWLLTGKDKVLLTTSFAIKGKFDNVSVESIPLDTLTGPTLGLLKRTLGLPFKLLENPEILWGGEGNDTEK